MHFEDGLYAGLCGTGSPMPNINCAGSCVAVLAGEHFLVVDAGEGSTRRNRLPSFSSIRLAEQYIVVSIISR